MAHERRAAATAVNKRGGVNWLRSPGDDSLAVAVAGADVRAAHARRVGVDHLSREDLVTHVRCVMQVRVRVSTAQRDDRDSRAASMNLGEVGVGLRQLAAARDCWVGVNWSSVRAGRDLLR